MKGNKSALFSSVLPFYFQEQKHRSNFKRQTAVFERPVMVFPKCTVISHS